MASLAIGIYSPGDVIVTMNGIPISGFAEDSFVSSKETTPQASVKQGCDGGIYATQIKGGVPGELKIKLSQTSLSNNAMVLALAQQKLGILNAFSVINAGGGESTFYPRGFIAGTADQEYGKEAGEREWTIVGACFAQPSGNEF